MDSLLVVDALSADRAGGNPYHTYNCRVAQDDVGKLVFCRRRQGNPQDRQLLCGSLQDAAKPHGIQRLQSLEGPCESPGGSGASPPSPTSSLSGFSHVGSGQEDMFVVVKVCWRGWPYMARGARSSTNQTQFKMTSNTDMFDAIVVDGGIVTRHSGRDARHHRRGGRHRAPGEAGRTASTNPARCIGRRCRSHELAFVLHHPSTEHASLLLQQLGVGLDEDGDVKLCAF
ncbi:hypothetical protein EDB80DRAFT_687467 [Ilyonectria destructans]|nr:hypothetical protein EDB80DRAFT_687467 [Ilyonectria destructans]